jgi:nicotinamidase-related amidase
MPAGEALLVLDMINAFDFEGGAALARESRRIAPRIAAIKAGVLRRRGACIYVNDNFGRWNSDLSGLVGSVAGTRGEAVLDALRPTERDHFILKPKHSGFYQTPLPQLLERLQCRTLIVTGQAAESCVMLTALDAHMRDFDVRVPSNAVASGSPARKSAALLLLRHAQVDTRAMT